MRVKAYMFKQSLDIDFNDPDQYREYKLDLVDKNVVSGEKLETPVLLSQKEGEHSATFGVFKNRPPASAFKQGDEVNLVLRQRTTRMVIHGRIAKIYKETCPVSDIFVVEVEAVDRHYDPVPDS